MNRLQKLRTLVKQSDWFGPSIEITPGGGDLRYGSVPAKREGNAFPSWFGLHGWGEPGLVRTPDGRTVSYNALYATQPWVYATVNRYLSWFELVPIKVYRRGTDADGKESRIRLRAEDHPLAAAIERPWRGGSSSDLMTTILMSMLVHGNSTVEVESGARGSLSFTPLDWRGVTPQQVAAHYISGWTFEDQDFEEQRTITADNMLHVTWASPWGPIGVSPLCALGVTLNAEIAAQEYTRNYLGQGANPSIAIETMAEFFGGLEQEERDALLADFRDQITAKYTGTNNAGVPMMLPPGMKVSTLSHTAQEAVLIENRKLNREEVEAVYLMPPPMVGQLDHATFSNIDTQRQMGYADTLGPQAVKICDAINTQVVRDLLGETDIYVEADLQGVLRGNPEAQTTNLAIQFQNGVITRNEWRQRINMERIPSSVDPTADQYFIASNNMGVAADQATTNGAAADGQGDIQVPIGG